MSDSAKPSDHPEDSIPSTPEPRATPPSEHELQDGMIDFDSTVHSNHGGTSSLNLGRVSEPVSGASIVSWAELLRQQQVQPSEPDVVLGSLPDIQIDAVSDNDIIRHLEREGVRVTGRSGVLKKGSDSKSGNTLPAPSGGSAAGLSGQKSNQGSPIPLPPAGPNAAVFPMLTPSTSSGSESGLSAAKLFTHQPPAKDEWSLEAASGDPQSSSIDLRTAARMAGQALGDESGVRSDESDVLAHALLSDDAGSAVNLGLEPRGQNVVSNASLLQKVAAMRAVVPGPMPPSKRPGSMPNIRKPIPVIPWLGGVAIGVLLATGLALGVGVFKRPIIVAPPAQAQQATTVAKTDPPSAQRARQHLELGEPDEALKILEACESTSQVLANRGLARWLAYVRQQRRSRAALAENDAAVVSARKDLQNAHLAEATLWLGLIDESFQHATQAREVYRRGGEEHPEHRRLFEAALARLDALTGKAPRAASAPAHPQLGLALSMLLLQAGTTETQEAGFDYWEAMQLARQSKFAEANQKLIQAKVAHEERRAILPKEGLNPQSDPREEIFLHSCDQLLAYWAAQAKLHSGGYDSGENTTHTIATLLDTRKRLDVVMKSVSSRLKTDRVDEFGPALDALVSERKKAEDDYRQAEKTVRMLQQDLSNSQASLDQVSKTAAAEAKATLVKLDAANAREAEARKSLAEFALARKEAEDVAKTLTQKLHAAKLVSATPKPQEVLAAIDSLMTGDLAARQAEVMHLRSLLSQSRSPVQMLDVWPVILEKGASREIADPALADADAVAKNAGADERARARAIGVRALALMAREDYVQARTMLRAARNEASLSGDARWSDRLKKAETELSDVSLVGGHVRKLLERGEAVAAIESVERGLKIFARDAAAREHGYLLALRSETMLKLNRLPEAERDAQAAQEAGAISAGGYAAGRIAEKRQDWELAKRQFQTALTAAGDGPEVKPIRVALARVLARPDASTEDLARAETLAEEAIKAGQAEGHLVKARVLYRLKKHTEALDEALLGLKSFAPAEYGDGWEILVRSHPALQRPEVAFRSDPELAERYFSGGLRSYYERKYEEAETAFAAALKHHGQDARFFYFLGLSRLPQGKIEAAQDDFRQAVLLERQGMPDSRTVAEYFERIQGPERQMINKFRK